MSYDIIEVLEAFDSYENELNKTVEAYKNHLQNIRAGRANPHILDRVLVDYYGTPTPINQLGSISVPEAKIILISVWDNGALKSVEKAIIDANVGITPNNDGKVIRLIFPDLTEERRQGLVKELKQLTESSKVALRNARRDVNETVKKLKKDGLITEDDVKDSEKDVDKQLNDYVTKLDKLYKEKEAEILSV